MKGALGTVIGGMVTFYVATLFLTTLITGTDAGSNLITTIGPILLSLVVIYIILRAAGNI